MKSAMAAAVSLVAVQSKAPDPSITLTICARSTIISAVNGRDQKIINREVICICSRNSFIFFSWNFRVSVGKAAREYDTPISDSAIVSWFQANDRTETEPGAC